VAFLAGEHRTHPHRRHLGGAGNGLELAPDDHGPGPQLAAAGHVQQPALHLDVVGQHPAEQPVAQVADGLAAAVRTGSVMPRSVPQSAEATMTSWETSTSRRVR